MVRSRYARVTVEVYFWYGRGTLPESSWYARDVVEVHSLVRFRYCVELFLELYCSYLVM